MCQYCDEKALPCLMCGRACMEYQLDRTRCRGALRRTDRQTCGRCFGSAHTVGGIWKRMKMKIKTKEKMKWQD